MDKPSNSRSSPGTMLLAPLGFHRIGQCPGEADDSACCFRVPSKCLRHGFPRSPFPAVVWALCFLSCGAPKKTAPSVSRPNATHDAATQIDRRCGASAESAHQSSRVAVIYESTESTIIELSNESMECGAKSWTNNADPSDLSCKDSRPSWWSRFAFPMPIPSEPGRYELQAGFGSLVKQETRVLASASERCVNAQKMNPLQGSSATLVIERVTKDCVFGRFEGIFPLEFAQVKPGGFSLDVNGSFVAQRCSG